MAASDNSTADGGDRSEGSDRAGDGTNETGDDPDQPKGRPCPACSEPMYRRHCKYVCPQHGVVYDCSDTFY